MAISPSTSVDFQSSTSVSDCIEAQVKHHGCSPTYTRDDTLGEGIDVRQWPKPNEDCAAPNACDITPTPTCTCGNASIRSGRHLVTDTDNNTAEYVEPAARTFEFISNSIDFNGTVESGATNDDRLIAGTATTGVKASCYPLQVRTFIQARAFHAVLDGASSPQFWIGYAQWSSQLNGAWYNLETRSTVADESSSFNVCEVFGYGGNINYTPPLVILQPGEELTLSLNFRARLVGPLGDTEYPARINGGRIMLEATEVTSLATPELEQC